MLPKSDFIEDLKPILKIACVTTHFFKEKLVQFSASNIFLHKLCTL